VPFLVAGRPQERLRGCLWWVGMPETVAGAGNAGFRLWERDEVPIANGGWRTRQREAKDLL